MSISSTPHRCRVFLKTGFWGIMLFSWLAGGFVELGAQTHLQQRTVLAMPDFQSDSTRTEKRAAKSPQGALLRSLALPGWGQFYNGQIIKAFIVLAGQGTLVGFAIYYHNKQADAGKRAIEFSGQRDFYLAQEDFYRDRRNLMFWLMGATKLLSMLDAYIDAHLYDFDAGPDLALRVGALPDASKPVVMGLSLRARF